MDEFSQEQISRIVARAVAGATISQSPALPLKQDMTLRAARLLIQKVEQRALEIGVKAVIAVSNKGARPVAVACMDDAYIASFDVAMKKAYTCAALKMSTSALKELTQPGQPLYGIQFTNNGQIVIFGGGVPLVSGGEVIGGLGVSGGSEEQDTALAAYGESVFGEIVSCL